MSVEKPKKTKAEIREIIKLTFFYFVIQVFAKDILFFVCLEAVGLVIGLLPIPDIIFNIAVYIISFILMEYVMQRAVFKYVYEHCSDQLNKYWWTEIIKISVIPLIFYYIIAALAMAASLLDLADLLLILILWNGVHIFISDCTYYRAYKKRISDREELLNKNYKTE